MNHDMKNNFEGANRIISRLTLGKKKNVLAIGLVAVMGFMWVRVLTSKSPQGVEAASEVSAVSGDKPDSQFSSKLTFVELPNKEGRNDVLTRDFFAINAERISDTSQTGIISEGEGDRKIKRIMKNLKLETILLGESPQAFINNKLLGIGDTFLVKDGAERRECEITGIEENSVVVRYEEEEVTLRLSHLVEVEE